MSETSKLNSFDEIETRPLTGIHTSSGFSSLSDGTNQRSALNLPVLPTSSDVTPKVGEAKETVYRWNSIDKYLCIVGPVLMVYGQLHFALKMQEYHSEHKISHVEKGWFGYYKDNSDIQWRMYSENILLMVACIAGFSFLSNLVKKHLTASSKTPQHFFYIVFGLIFLIVLFRGNLLFWLFFVGLNYLLIEFAIHLPIFPALIWSLNIATLYFNDSYQGYKLVSFFHCDALQFLQDSADEQLIPWHVIFNMSILKMISFGMDKYWSINGRRFLVLEAHIKKCATCAKGDPSQYCLKYRYDSPHPIEDYSFLHFASFMLYAPLFITGPPLPFNAFISQIKYPSNIISTAPKYTLRTLFVYVVFEIFIHFDYSFAISTRSENSSIWDTFSPAEYLLCIFNLLFFIQLKFNTIWKVAKTWATWDNIEVPENMNRCVANNYNIEGFWRSWHRGFNQWLLRYIYFPLGGSKTKLWNIWVVFTFVAIWHDFQLKLLVWAWSICIFMIPEIGVKRFISQNRFRYLYKTHWWKYAVALVGAIYGIFLAFVNSVGFGMGVEIFLIFLQRVFSTYDSVWSFIKVLSVLAICVLQMFNLREHEDDPEKGF